jgi:hypothetical protein
MAYFYELEDLLKTCLDFIDRNAMEVLKTDVSSKSIFISPFLGLFTVKWAEFI